MEAALTKEFPDVSKETLESVALHLSQTTTGAFDIKEFAPLVNAFDKILRSKPIEPIIDYKLIIEVARIEYPDLIKEIGDKTKARPMTYAEIVKVKEIFQRLKGTQRFIGDYRDLFIAVLILIYDPLYVTTPKKIRTYLREYANKVLERKAVPNSISYIFKNIKHYLPIYPDLEQEANYLHRKILEELDG